MGIIKYISDGLRHDREIEEGLHMHSAQSKSDERFLRNKEISDPDNIVDYNEVGLEIIRRKIELYVEKYKISINTNNTSESRKNLDKIYDLHKEQHQIIEKIVGHKIRFFVCRGEKNV